ncbi:MAG TPA: PAS domain S-box protein [Gammaproteobacteria bacterium]|nr:PAS domain S-box protein [Gammaproteobacteria bacterium]
MVVIGEPSGKYWRRLPDNDAMLNSNLEIHQSGIARRLILYVILFSSFITLLLTALQLYRDYNTDIGLVEDQLQQVRNVHLKSLTAALWVSDTQELKTRLEGISRLRDMQSLEVRDQERVWVSVGTPQSRNMISKRYPMVYTSRGRDIRIGTLTVVASLKGVYQRLIDKVWVLLISNGIKTFLVTGFILVIFHTLITRHLIRIADFARGLDINTLDSPLGLERKSKHKQKTDELDLVVSAINRMQTNIKESFTALGQSEERFKILAKVSPVGIFRTDARGNCTYVNERWCELAGMNKAEALGEGWTRALHPKDRQRVFREWSQAVADRVPFHSEYRFQRPDDGVIWLLGSAEMEIDSGGQVVGYVGAITDITKRKRTEETVRNIAMGVSAQTGGAFFHHLVRHLAKMFNIDYAYIGVLSKDDPQQVNTLAMCDHGQIVDNISYLLAGTPCANVTGQSTCTYPSGVQQQFPEDRMLANMGVEGYIGTPLFDSRGAPLGILVVLDRKPLRHTEQVRELLEIFAVRAAAEIERLQAEEVLAHSKAEFEAMFNAIPDAVIFTDTERRIVMNNPAVHEIFGYSNQELIGGTAEILYADRKDFLEQGCLRYHIKSSAQQGTYEVRYKRKDGTVFWGETLGTQVKDTNGATIGFIGLFRDITERKRAKEIEAGFGQILDSSLNEIYIFDADTLQFIQVNRGAMMNLGYSMEELQRLTPLDLKPEVTHTSFEKLLIPLRNGDKERIQFNATHQRKDGSLYPVEVHLQLSSFESVAAFVAIILDITERRQAENVLRRSQKMEAIGQLSGGIAHDFNNQLGVIIGYLDFLKKHTTNDEKPHLWVDTATKATLRCMDLTRQLLAFSRRQITEKTVVDLNATLKELETMIARSVTPEVKLQYFLADDLWSTEIDPGEFQDAVLNLVINARDAMPGGGMLLVETTNKHLDAGYATLNPGVEPGDYVQLMLSDTGMGMSVETLEHVFEPFFTTKPEGKGTGLGMAMVYGFVKRYGGYIKVYSEPGVGTTIRLYLPRSTASEATVIANNVNEAELSTGCESILIVDDEVDLLALADRYLTDLGYRTLQAENAAQALEILRGAEQIDLLFSDVVMPGGMNGYELAQRATEQRPDLKVLLTSGFTAETIAHNGLARFSAHLLSKPYRKDDLAQRIRFVLDAEAGV